MCVHVGGWEPVAAQSSLDDGAIPRHKCPERCCGPPRLGSQKNLLAFLLLKGSCFSSCKLLTWKVGVSPDAGPNHRASGNQSIAVTGPCACRCRCRASRSAPVRTGPGARGCVGLRRLAECLYVREDANCGPRRERTSTTLEHVARAWTPPRAHLPALPQPPQQRRHTCRSSSRRRRRRRA